MKESLKINHIAPYLPYKVFYKRGSNKPIELKRYDEWLNMDGMKLILRPISDLIKKVDIDGQCFVPASILWNVEIKEEEMFDIYGEIPSYWSSCMSLDFANDLGYRDMKLLFKWHFDVFNLIEKGLAIDVNNLIL